MKKLHVPTPTKNISKFAGKWIAIDPVKDAIVAVGDSLKEIGPMVTRSPKDKRPAGVAPFSFLVPRKDEGPYILWIKRY